MIRKVYEVDPMLCPDSEASRRTAKRCPKCGGQMKVIAFIMDYAVVDRIIDHLRDKDLLFRFARLTLQLSGESTLPITKKDNPGRGSSPR